MLVTKMQAAVEERNYACDIHAYPASVLQNHKDVVVIVDEAAASKLSK